MEKHLWLPACLHRAPEPCTSVIHEVKFTEWEWRKRASSGSVCSGRGRLVVPAAGGAVLEEDGSEPQSVVCLLGPQPDHHTMFWLRQSVYALHLITLEGRRRRSPRHTAYRTSSISVPFFRTPTHRAYRVGNAGTIRLEHARWASAFSVSQGSTR